MLVLYTYRTLVYIYYKTYRTLVLITSNIKFMAWPFVNSIDDTLFTDTGNVDAYFDRRKKSGMEYRQCLTLARFNNFPKYGFFKFLFF